MTIRLRDGSVTDRSSVSGFAIGDREAGDKRGLFRCLDRS